MTGTIMGGSGAAGITNQAKMDFFLGGHVIAVTNVVSLANSFASPNTLIANIANTWGLAAGMWVNSSTQNAANVTFITRIINSTALEVSEPATGAGQQSTTFRGDSIFIALIKFAPGRSYDRNTSCLANLQVATSDEVSGAGYTTNGQLLVVNSPASATAGAPSVDITDSNTAIVQFQNPSWTSATIDAAGCMIYNWGAGNVAGLSRIGFIANGTSSNGTNVNTATLNGTSGGQRAISLHDFNGEQKVTAGTFTVNMPTANGTAAILRIA